MAMFQILSPGVFVWRQTDAAPIAPGSGSVVPRRRFEIYGQPAVFIYGLRRPTAVSGNASATLPSASATAAVGTVSAVGIQNAVVTLGSAVATAAVGAVTATSSSAAATSLPSALATAAVGTVSATATRNAVAALPGAAAAAAVGTVSATSAAGGGAVVVLPSAAAAAAAGAITATATRNATAVLVGVAAQAQVGVIYVGNLIGQRVSAPPTGHGPTLARRVSGTLRRRAPNLSTRTR